MRSKILLAASAAGLCVSAPLTAADPSLIADAKAFGAREAVQAPDLSPDGSTVLYITPGPGRRSIAVAGNLETGKFSPLASSDGGSGTLRWCHFVAAERAVCQFTGLDTAAVSEVIGYSRLLALNLDGGEPKQL